MGLREDLIALIERWKTEALTAPTWDGNVQRTDLEHASQVKEVLTQYQQQGETS